MITERWCLLVCLADNCWIDSPNRTDCTGETYHTKLRADIKAWNEIVDFAAENGCDSILLDIANGVRFDTHPEIAVEGAWTSEFMRSEVKRLREEKGIKLYPRLNFSAGHDAWLEEYSRMVSTQKYYEVAKDLIHEVCDMFDTPEFFSLVLDEENWTNQQRYDYACYRQYDLVWHDVEYLCNCIREKGVRPAIGGDYCWSYPEEFIKNVSKDVLVCNWLYGSFYGDEQHPLPTDDWSTGRYKSFKLLTENGFDIMLQGASYTNTHNYEHTFRYALENLNQDRIRGTILCGSWAAPMDDSKYWYMDAVYEAKYAREKFFGGK